jgi:cell division transport system ATP-binding protein
MATHDYHIIRTFPSRIIKCENGVVHEDAQIV